MIQCENLALYLDPDEKNLLSLSSSSSLEALTEALHNNQFESNFGFKKQNYILSPCSPSVVVTKNELPTIQLPRWTLKVELVGLNVSLLKKQYLCLNLLTYAMESQIISLNPNKKPPVAVKSNPKAWWKFAIHLVISENRVKKKQVGWIAISKRIVERHRYIQLYKRSKSKGERERESKGKKE